MCQHCGTKAPYTDGEHFAVKGDGATTGAVVCMNVRDSRTADVTL